MVNVGKGKEGECGWVSVCVGVYVLEWEKDLGVGWVSEWRGSWGFIVVVWGFS